jgi:hypothetical protein
VNGWRHKLGRLRDELRRSDLSTLDKSIRIADLALTAASLSPALFVGHIVVFELAAPPPPFRALRDLRVRAATDDDAAALAGVDGTAEALVRARLRRGDRPFVGELDGRALAHIWFCRGPTTFDEDVDLFARVALGPGTFWSYHGVAVADARTSGIFVKVFQTGLRAVFVEHGATRVLTGVRASNLASVAMHERMGFRRVGSLFSALAPGLRCIHWRGPDRRVWLTPRSRPPTLHLPRGGDS